MLAHLLQAVQCNVRHCSFHKWLYARICPFNATLYSYISLGEYHTLIMVDPDIPAEYEAFGSQSTPFLHMLVTNIREGEFSTGDVLRSYTGSAPPDDAPHTYYFLLYKQTVGQVSTTSDDVTRLYTFGCDR